MALPLEKFVQRLADCGVLDDDTITDFMPPKANPKDGEEIPASSEACRRVRAVPP